MNIAFQFGKEKKIIGMFNVPILDFRYHVVYN